jgi:hypothetical protein
MAQIYKATVTFVLPSGDDRDFDTVTQIVVRGANGAVIAENDNVAPGQHLVDPGTYGPYALSVVDANATPSDFAGGQSQLIIHPNGHDRWITNNIIFIYWNDGNGATCQSHTIIVDQNVNSATWPNSQASLAMQYVPPGGNVHRIREEEKLAGGGVKKR